MPCATVTGMETNTLHDKLDGLPWLYPHAIRLEELVGFTVVAAPQGPMGPKHLGTLTSWAVHDEDRLVCVVDTADGPEVECYHYDLHDARQPLR